MKLEDLRVISNRAAEVAKAIERLRKDLQRLRSTRLIRFLDIDGKLPTRDMLHPTCAFMEPFQGILDLPRLATSYQPGKQPDFNYILTKIIRHVHENTGRWNDRLVAEVLHALELPHGTEEALRQWRKDRGLVVRRKR